MATKLATGQPAIVQGQHTSGIFADMTVDGPEIGTLVVIVDRAKNLPNRKSMGKQNPYCAARLGKEAKKTDTDRRGGQTPKWDQELRFTVHDSLDYHNLKVSVFSEDKKTDLIGEAWVKLDDILAPGGGKNDIWQTLSCKGKYSGEIRIELTFYDSRPKPEKRVPVPQSEQNASFRQDSLDKVRRRPLPGGSRGPLTPDTISEPLAPGRARHGPRNFRTLPRANSMPPETIESHMTPSQHRHDPRNQQQQDIYGSSPPGRYRDQGSELPIPLHRDYEDHSQDMREYDQYAQPDFLPTLPPLAPRQRVPVSHDRQLGANALTRPAHLSTLPHAHSDPVIPHRDDFDYNTEDDLGLYIAGPEPLNDLDYQHDYVQQKHMRGQVAWQDSPIASQQHHAEDSYDATPPRPPHHTRSTSALPSHISPISPITPDHNAFGRMSLDTPPSRPMPHPEQYISNSSPLQSIERGIYDVYHSSPPQQQQRPSEGPSNYPDQAPYSSPVQYRNAQVRNAQSQQRHSMSSLPRQNIRQSPHPLSQELPHERNPVNSQYQATSAAEVHRYRDNLDRTAMTPIARPRPISPARQSADSAQKNPNRSRKSVYSIQNPVRAFESSDVSPLSTPGSAGNTPNMTGNASYVQPRFSSGIPFSPDSFDIDPQERHASLPDQHVMDHNNNNKRTITGWDGREIDPSDHLPVASWAPEPESKTQPKAYGQGRDRDFGPRNLESNGARIGKDVTVNVHRRGQSADTAQPTTIKARLVKKNAPARSSPIMPLQEHPNYNSVPDPYAQQDYSPNFANGSPGQQNRYDDRHHHPYSVPNIPPKVPLEYGQDALSREIAGIDIGSGTMRNTAPAPTAYIPVRSHRDRSSFY